MNAIAGINAAPDFPYVPASSTAGNAADPAALFRAILALAGGAIEEAQEPPAGSCAPSFDLTGMQSFETEAQDAPPQTAALAEIDEPGEATPAAPVEALPAMPVPVFDAPSAPPLETQGADGDPEAAGPCDDAAEPAPAMDEATGPSTGPAVPVGRTAGPDSMEPAAAPDGAAGFESPAITEDVMPELAADRGIQAAPTSVSNLPEKPCVQGAERPMETAQAPARQGASDVQEPPSGPAGATVVAEASDAPEPPRHSQPMQPQAADRQEEAQPEAVAAEADPSTEATLPADAPSTRPARETPRRAQEQEEVEPAPAASTPQTAPEQPAVPGAALVMNAPAAPPEPWTAAPAGAGPDVTAPQAAPAGESGSMPPLAAGDQRLASEGKDSTPEAPIRPAHAEAAESEIAFAGRLEAMQPETSAPAKPPQALAATSAPEQAPRVKEDAAPEACDAAAKEVAPEADAIAADEPVAQEAAAAESIEPMEPRDAAFARPKERSAEESRTADAYAPRESGRELTPAPQTESPAAAPANPARVRTVTAAKAAAAAEIAPPRESAPAAQAREITLALEGEDARVQVRLQERQGEIQVDVRTGDASLAGDLRRDLPALTQRLENAGFRAESWQTGTDRDTGGEGAGNAPADSQSRQGRQSGEHRQQRQAQSAEEAEQGLESNKEEREFSWWMASQ